MRLAEASIAAAINVTLWHQFAVDVVGVERIGRSVIEGDRIEMARFEVLPHLFAFLQPSADIVLGELARERDVVLPTIELAHLEQIGA